MLSDLVHLILSYISIEYLIFFGELFFNISSSQFLEIVHHPCLDIELGNISVHIPGKLISRICS